MGDRRARRVLARRRIEVDLVESAHAESLESTVGSDELSHELVGRLRQQVVGGRHLDELAVAHDRDPVAHLDRLVDVVGDEDDRLRNLAMEPQEVVLESVTGDRVDRAERLVHQHDRGVGGHRPGDADALLLAAGELPRVALEIEDGIESDELEQLGGAVADAVLRPAKQPRHGADVVLDRHVREQPDLLEHVADAAPQLGELELAHAAAVDRDVALGDRDQAVDHLQRGRLAAPRRADEHADLPGRHLEAEVLHGCACAPGIALDHVFESDLGRRRIRELAGRTSRMGEFSADHHIDTR